MGLLSQLQQGDQLFVGPDRTDYPYAIQNVAPGPPVPTAMATMPPGRPRGIL